ncbi:Putative short-chain dehydrogenase/reductase SDR, NAD(P)-binding domain superfamily [Colletotrichum destructivum]|uniref:Short-chain dehydrogenase/reductase SDR, NAD(P)-binding domain superfamily n=1 Tax=Colletotrichum destructivum TaxID=34406 RepID=A0AAX4IER5_9PEZI|nr:Putative short-chain dehydrogenase/reductase SDR, NAD(P)-binding domain superfamily [Colletotrichum destructivum]
MASKSFYAIISGVGSGTGRAAAIRFSKAYTVVLLARKPESYNSIVDEIKQAGGQAFGLTADATDEAAVNVAFETIKKQLPGGKLAAAIYNVNGGFARKPFLELKREELDASLDAAPKGFFTFAQKTLPLLLESVPESPHPPSLIITGATASIKGSALFGSFAAGKFALRALGQSLAREFGPKGVHVSHAIIDGGIDTPWGKDFVANNGVEDGKISPDAIAETYWHLHTQHRSAFTQEVDIRPYVEKF